jgi:precorrin-6B methylase 2
MQAKLFGRVAAGVFISFFAAAACAEPAKDAPKTEEVQPPSGQEANVAVAEQPVTEANETGPVKPATAPQGKVAAAAPPPKAAVKTEEFTPSSGQEGKDVVWVPTPEPLVTKMLDMAKLTSNDILVDLGSGDGRTVIAGAKRGARSTGVEFNPQMVELSRRIAEQEGVAGRARFVQGDFFETDFSNATVLTLFLMTDLNLKLRPKILDMKPGTRVVSNTFTMGEWKADDSQSVSDKEGCTGYCTAHLWIVPAKVEGRWKLPAGELALMQSFQTVSGTLGGNPISNATLRGDQISFNAGNAQYTGRVNGRTLTGTVKSGSNSTPFTATRVGA